MASQTYIHVVKKDNISEHAAVPINTSTLPPLDAGHVRLRSAIISLTYNNLTYARMGSIRNWWDAFTVPLQLPAPYNDCSQYGIAPCWGYGEVLESNVHGLEAGMMLWGYWPLSGWPVDYQLVAGDAPGHWLEVSKQRENLMPFYNRYTLRDPGLRLKDLHQRKMELMGRSGVYAVWECGYLLNQYCFKEPYVHPQAREAPPDQPWTKERAGLKDAVVVNLSAGGRTARTFIDFAVHERGPGAGPLGMLSITGQPKLSAIDDAPFPYKAISYRDIAEGHLIAWLEKLKPQKIVICDFGGRGDSLFTLLETLRTGFPSVELVVVGIGMEGKAWTHDGTVQKLKKRMVLPERVQMNTGPIRDTLIEQRGAESYFEEIDAAWDRFIGRGNLESTKLVWGDGVMGESGIEGGWQALCDGTLAGDAAFAYKMY